MVYFQVPWVETSSGVALQEGEKVTFTVPGVKSVAFGIYPSGSNAPIIIGQSQVGVDHVTTVIKRADKSIKGKAVLKINAVLQNNTQSTFEKEFTII